MTPSKRPFPLQPSTFNGVDALTSLINAPNKGAFGQSAAMGADQLLSGGVPGAVEDGVPADAGESRVDDVEVDGECDLAYHHATFESRGVKHVAILLKNAPPCESAEVASNVIEAQTIELTFPDANLASDQALRMAAFVNEKILREETGNATTLKAFASMAAEDTHGRTFTCKFRIGFKVDATRMKLITTDLPIGANGVNKSRAIIIIAPELQENVANSGQVLELM
jgi:hypothetical protein